MKYLIMLEKIKNNKVVKVVGVIAAVILYILTHKYLHHFIQ